MTLLMKDKDIAERRSYIKSINKMPKALILAEIFIIILCMSYVMKISGFALDIVESEKQSLMNVALLEMNVIFFGTTLFAALGIYSHKPEAWRKVVRSCITFTVAMIISSVYTSESNAHAFDFNPVITLISLISLFLMMIFSNNIRRFYTPPMMDVPKISEWIRFIFFGKLIDSDYVIDFRTDMTEPTHDTSAINGDTYRHT